MVSGYGRGRKKLVIRDYVYVCVVRSLLGVRKGLDCIFFFLF